MQSLFFVFQLPLCRFKYETDLEESCLPWSLLIRTSMKFLFIQYRASWNGEIYADSTI